MELDKPINWPENARCAVAFTFDPDVEALWFFDPKNRNKPKTLSLGTYGIKRGLPRILDLMEQYEIPSTFFTLGWFAEEYPEVMKEIHSARALHTVIYMKTLGTSTRMKFERSSKRQKKRYMMYR